MKRIRGYVVFLFILAMLVVPYRAFAFLGLDIGVSYWKPTPSGTMEYKPVAGYPGDIDLKNDLNLDSTSELFVRIKAELPSTLPNIYLMATSITFEGPARLTRDISFGDRVFSAGSWGLNFPIESKIKLDHYDLALFYPIPMLKTATADVLNAELGINARKYDFEGTIRQMTQTGMLWQQTALLPFPTKRFSFYVPMIYGGIQIQPVSSFSIEAEIRGIANSKNHYYDYLGRIRYNPVPAIYIAGGFRTEIVKMDRSDVKTNIRFGAPFIEAGFSY